MGLKILPRYGVLNAILEVARFCRLKRALQLGRERSEDEPSCSSVSRGHQRWGKK